MAVAAAPVKLSGGFKAGDVANGKLLFEGLCEGRLCDAVWGVVGVVLELKKGLRGRALKDLLLLEELLAKEAELVVDTVSIDPALLGVLGGSGGKPFALLLERTKGRWQADFIVTKRGGGARDL